NAFGREQQRLAQGYGATEEELARRERSDVRGSEANQNAISQLLGLSQMNNTRQGNAIDQLAQLGATERGVAQQGNESAYNELLRRQALAESATYQPFGSAMPSALGSRQMSTGK